MMENHSDKTKKAEVYFLIFLLVIAIALRIFISTCYYWDELVYMQHADIFSGKIDNYNEFDIRPPMLPMMISGLYSLWHNPLLANILVTLISAFSVILIYFLGKEVFNKKIGLIAAALLTFWPLHVIFSKQILVHTTALFFGMLFFLLLKKGENTRKSWPFFFSGIFLGISVLTRFTYIILFPLLAVEFALFIKHYNLKNVILFCLGAAAALLPYFLWSKAAYGSFFYTLRQGSTFSISASNNLGFYFANLGLVLGIAGTIGMLLWIFFKFKDKAISRSEIVMLAWILLPIIALSLMPHKEIRYLIITLCPFVLLSSIGMLRLYEYMKRKPAILILLAAIILLGLVFINYNPYARECNNDAKFASAWIMNNTLSNETVYVQDYYPYVGYYTDRKVIIAPLDRYRFLNKNNPFFKENGPGYLIYFQAQNTSNLENLEDLQNDTRFSLIDEFRNNEEIYIFRVNKL